MSKALVLSGGGSKGAYQVGVLKALVERGHKWDFIAGVSVGALNAAFLAMFDIEQQHQAAFDLEKMWLQNITNNNSIYRGWAPGLLTYLPAAWKGSVYSTEPLRLLIQKAFNHQKMIKTNVEVVVGACSVNTGEYLTIDKKNQRFLDFVLASASFPIAFPPVNIGGELFTDGGVRTIVPIMDAIAAGATDIDVILTSPHKHPMRKVASGAISKIMPLTLRITDILLDEVYASDLARIEHLHNVKINVYAPTTQARYSSLYFNSANIKTLIQDGYADHKSISKVYD